MSQIVFHIGEDRPSRDARSAVLRAVGIEVCDFDDWSSAVHSADAGAASLVVLEADPATGEHRCAAARQQAASPGIPLICVARVDGGSRCLANAAISDADGPEALVAVVRSVLRTAAVPETRRIDILEGLPEVFFAMDDELRLTYVNAEAERLFGLGRERLIGRGYEEIDADNRTAIESYRRALGERSAVEFEDYRQSTARRFAVKANPTQPGGLAVFLRDITEEKRAKGALEIARQRLLNLLGSSVIGIAIATTDGLSFANDEFLRVVGYSRDDLEAGRANWTKATPPEYRDADVAAMQELATSGRCTPFEKEYVHTDGTRVPILIGAVRLQETPLEWAAFVVDLTHRKQAERLVRDYEQRLRLAAESAGVGVWDMDVVSGEVGADAQVARMFGFEEPARSLAEYMERVHPDDLEETISALRSATVDGGTYEVEYRTVTGAGIRWIYARGTAVRDPRRQSTRLVGIAQDITDRRRHEDELRSLTDTMNFHMFNTPAAVVEYDSDFRIIRWGGQAESMFGWKPSEVLGKRYDEFRWLYDEDAERVGGVARQLAAGTGRLRCENRNYTKDGAVVHMDWFNSSRTDQQGRLLSLLCLGVDVTARAEAERELNRLARELRRSNQELQQFAFAVSHDLQEPLRNIATLTDLFCRRFDGSIPPEGVELLQHVLASAERMRRLINDVLEYSRVTQTSSLAVGLVDLEGTLAFALSNLARSIAETNAEITHDALPKVTGDAIRLAQLFQNLVGNAIKYRSPGQRPRVHVSAKAGHSGEWEFSVADNGIGIEAQYRESIFTAFKRLHGRDVPGTGIGLAVAKRIVEQHGGRIWVESAAGEGSTFYFTLADHAGQESVAAVEG